MGKKKGSKKSSKKGGKKPDAGAIQTAAPTAMELSLRLELAQLEKELTIVKKEADAARLQNDFLLEEVKKTDTENGDYETYMQKKTMREQDKIAKLEDAHTKQIDAIEQEMSRKEAEARVTKAKLNEKILLRKSEIKKTREHIERLSEVSKKREEQEQEISELETQIMQIQEKHFEEIQSLKSHFLLEKVGFQEEANERVKGLQKKSQAEAIGYLTSHSRIVKADNIKLRRTLLALIEYNKQQQANVQFLENHNASLRRQIELDRDLVRLVKGSSSLTLGRPLPTAPRSMTSGADLGSL